jgi:hypothetical protein
LISTCGDSMTWGQVELRLMRMRSASTEVVPKAQQLPQYLRRG